jgi:hypothetical protein
VRRRLCAHRLGIVTKSFARVIKTQTRILHPGTKSCVSEPPFGPAQPFVQYPRATQNIVVWLSSCYYDHLAGVPVGRVSRQFGRQILVNLNDTGHDLNRRANNNSGGTRSWRPPQLEGSLPLSPTHRERVLASLAWGLLFLGSQCRRHGSQHGR